MENSDIVALSRLIDTKIKLLKSYEDITIRLITDDIENANKSIIKVQDIVSLLDGSLKMKYQISDNLAALYAYFKEQLITANIKKDAEIVKELIPFFSELKETFGEISKKGY